MLIIRNMIKSDTNELLEMMREFYNSPAVFTNGSDDIFKKDIENCINNFPYLEGYVFCKNKNILGYAMVAKSFSTEFGKPCIWIEDLYIKAEFRGCGIGTKFFNFIEQKFPNFIVRLEVEENNKNAVSLYKKCGFEVLPYLEMKKTL